MAKFSSLDCVSMVEVWAASRTGDNSGESEAGLTVGLAVDLMSWSTRLAAHSLDTLCPSCELKSSCDRVMGLSWSELIVDDDRATTPEPHRKRFSSSTKIKFAFWAFTSMVSSSLLRSSRASTSRRLRSRDDWAARRFLKTRSTRRCSFSSSVLARFLLHR